MTMETVFLNCLDFMSTIVHYLLKLRDLLYQVCYVMEISLPPTPGTRVVTKEFLSYIFGQDVMLVKHNSLTENRGFVGSMVRIEVEFDHNVTKTLMLKTSPSTVAARKNIMFGGGGVREALFYKSTFATRLKEQGRIPNTYFAHASRWMGEMVLLMEDLQGAIPVNHLMGNQIWGLPENIPKVDKMNMLHAMFLHAATLHAQFWKDTSILKEQWLRGSCLFRGRGRLEWEITMGTSKRGWDKLKENTDIMFPVGFTERLDTSFEMSSFDSVVEHCKSAPWTLTHGDYHAANMMVFIGEDTSTDGLLQGLKIFDWSEVGPWEPTTDLAQTCVSDLPREFFPKVRAVLKDYHIALTSMGVDDFSWEDCEKRFGESGMERWIWVLGCMAHLNCPVILFQYFVDQMEALRLEFCPNKADFTLKTCGYFLGS